MRTVVALACLTLALVPVATASGVAVVGVYPNPPAAGDAGERVTISVPPGTDLGALALTDGESTVALPNVTASGRVVLTADAASVPDGTAGRVVALPDFPSLANGGDGVRVVRGNETLARATYDDAPEGSVYDPESGTWHPLGATTRESLTVSRAPVRAFVLPDDAAPVRRALRSAEDRVLVAAYTFTSRRFAASLRRAAARGVEVRVLVEGGPVGGVSRRQARVLSRLARSPVSVRVVDGPRARYRFHHAKYAVVDDRALVTSENWEAGGLGGGGSRGWGVLVSDARVAADLASLFDADFGWQAATPWARWRRNATVHAANHSADPFPSRFPPLSATAGVRVVTAPDNARGALLDVVRSAEDTLRVEQVRIDRDTALYDATVAAARRGVEVRVLVSGAWYVAEENRRFARRLRSLAAAEDLPIEVRLARPRSRFDHLHVKGVVADGRRVVVGSINWNDVAVTENREVAVVLEGDRVGGYYARVFRADWRGGAWRVPVAVAGAVAASAVGAAAALRRQVSFSRGSDSSGGSRRSPRPPSSRRGSREPPPASRRRT